MLKDFKEHKPQVHRSAYICEQALLIGKITIASGVSVWPGCVLRGDIEEIIINENSNIQDGVIVHTNIRYPTIVGKGVTVGHGVIIHGCLIGDNCLIGMGARLLNGVIVEDNCIIGAGAVVTENTKIPEGSVVFGIPGKVVRSVTEEEIRKIKRSACDYKKLAAIYTNASRGII